MNMVLAVLLSDEGETEADNCDWYFISLFTDVFIGVFICWMLLRMVEGFAVKYGIE